MATTTNNQASPATVQQYLDGLDYPCSKQDLIDYARRRSAPHDVISVLNRIPDQQYNSPITLSEAIGKIE